MADPVQITQNQIGFAQEVAPFAQDVLGGAQALTSYDQNPYQKYTGEQVAQFSPLQQQSYDYAQQMTAAPQLQDATALAGQAGLGGLNAQYTFNPANFTAANAQALMNPYTDVMDASARRNAAIAQQQQQAQAATHGAFGSSGDYLMRAQGNADLQRQLGQNQYNAFQNAQQQYNTQNQQNAQQQQFGANLGMQGLQTALQGANALGSLGQTQFAQNVGLTGLQNQLGLQQQQQAQNVLNTNYQNFLSEQNDPYKRLGFYSDIVRGAPLMQTGSSVYAGAPTAMQNLTSLGLGAYGLNSLFGTGTGKAAGGSIKGYANGGSVTSREFKEYAVDNVPPQMLSTVQQNAQGRGDLDTYQLAMEKMAQDAALRRGIAPALPAGASVVRAAGGGILAFKDEGFVDSENDPQSGQVISANYVGAADPELLKKGAEYIEQMGDFRPESMTPEQEQAAHLGYFTTAQKELGANEGATAFRNYLQEAQADRPAALQQAKGLGALKAAAAVLRPGGFAGGLSAATDAFSDVYGKALEADRKEKGALAMAGFHLAQAERSEKMGLRKDADSALAAHKSSIREANKFNFDKLKGMSDATVRLAQASRKINPPRTGGAGGGEKEWTYATRTYLPKIQSMYPDLSPEEQNAKAYEMYQQNKSAGLPGVQLKTESTEDEKARERASKRVFTDSTYNEAIRKKDQAAATKRRLEILTEEQKKPAASTGGDASGAPKPVIKLN